MNDAYTIGITLALDNGVSEGIAVIRRDLASLDAAVAGSMAGLAQLRAAAAGIGGAGLDPATARLIGEGRKLLGGLPRPVLAPAQPVPAAATVPPEPTTTPDPRFPAPGPSDAPRAPIREPHRPAVDQVAEPDRAPGGAPSPAPVIAAAPPASALATYPVPRAPVAPQPDLGLLPAGTPAASPAPAAPPAASSAAPTPRAQPLSQARAPRSLDIVDLQSFARRLTPPDAPPAPAPAMTVPTQDPTVYRTDIRRGTQPAPRPMLAAPPPAGQSSRAAGERRIERVVAPTSPAAPAIPVPVAPTPGPMAPGAATPFARPAAPPPRTADAPASGHGDVYLDGTLIGRWMVDHLAQEAGRPPAGLTGFDPRMSRIWPGAPIGN